jgi:hypothetical protein
MKPEDGRKARINPRDLLKALPVGIEAVEIPEVPKKPAPEPKVRKQPKPKTVDATNGANADATVEGDQVAHNTESKPKYRIQPRWKPGESGNPAGRPKAAYDFQAMCREASPQAFRKLVELIDSDDERVSFMAANTIIDRAWGKPKTIEGDAEKSNLTINIVRMGPDEPQIKTVNGNHSNGIQLRRFSDA